MGGDIGVMNPVWNVLGVYGMCIDGLVGWVVLILFRIEWVIRILFVIFKGGNHQNSDGNRRTTQILKASDLKIAYIQFQKPACGCGRNVVDLPWMLQLQLRVIPERVIIQVPVLPAGDGIDPELLQHQANLHLRRTQFRPKIRHQPKTHKIKVIKQSQSRIVPKIRQHRVSPQVFLQVHIHRLEDHQHNHERHAFQEHLILCGTIWGWLPDCQVEEIECYWCCY